VPFQLFLTQPTGKAGWVVVSGNKTYFEGKVTDPQGKPVKDALIRKWRQESTSRSPEAAGIE